MLLNGLQCSISTVQRVADAGDPYIRMVNGKCFGADGRWRKEWKGLGDKASGRGEGSTGSVDVRNLDERSRWVIRFGWPASSFVSVDWSPLVYEQMNDEIYESALKI